MSSFSSSRAKGVSLIFLSTLIYGFQSVLTRVVLTSGMPPVTLAAIKLVGGLITLSVMVIVTKQKLSFNKKDWKLWLVFGIVGGAFLAITLAASFALNGASQAIILLYTAPAFVIILAKVYLKEDITKIKVIALIAVLIGTILVAVGGMNGSIKVTAFGLFVGLASGFVYAIFTVLSKKLSYTYNSMSINFYMVLIAVIFMLPAFPTFDWGMIFGEHLNLTLVALFYGFMIYGAANFLFVQGMKYLDAGTVSVLANTEPILAIILSVLILKESLTPMQVVGVIAVLAGAFLVSKGNKDKFQELSG